MTRAASQWFEQGNFRTHDHGTDLVVFPYAGGNPSAFRNWLQPDLTGCNVLIASLPGRGKRFGEAPINHFDTVVEQLVSELEPLLSKKFVLFGHSLGAYIAFEVARRLRRPPLALFVSGANSPSRRSLARKRRADMNDHELIDELRRLDGTPKAILEHAELLELLMPSIRADFEVVDSYLFRPGPPLTCPIYALGSSEDVNVHRDGLEAWLEQTQTSGGVKTFPGDHFYIHEHEEKLLTYLRETILFC